MNDQDLKPPSSGFTVRKNPLETFLLDLAMREGQMIQVFFSRVVGSHFPRHFLELYMIDQKQIPGLNMKLRCEPLAISGEVVGTTKNLTIDFKGKTLGSCKVVHRDYPELLVVSLIDVKIETCPTPSTPVA